MELLTIQHTDFTMIVECAKFDDIWHKAKSNIGEECLHSTYSWSEGVSSVILSNYIGEEITIENSQQTRHIFRQHRLSYLGGIQELCEKGSVWFYSTE